MLNLYLLRSFVAVAETLNYRRAAEQLNMAQPALSRQIQQLESELGAVLFERTKRRVALTPAGTYLRHEAEHLLAEAARVARRTGQIQRGEAGEVRIGHSSSSMQSVLPGLLRLLRDQLPDLHTELHELGNRTLVEQLLNRQLDLCLLPNATVPPTVASHTLYEEPFVLIVPAHLPLTGNGLADLRTYAHEPFILPPRPEGLGYVESVLRVCQEAGFTPQTAHESAYTASVLRLVEAGLGISIEPESSLRGVALNIRHEPIESAQRAVTYLIYLREREAELRAVLERLPGYQAAAQAHARFSLHPHHPDFDRQGLC
jgi:DNA-binding transcriptional LysR family regulator